MKKRILSLLFATILILSLVAACGTETTPTQSGTPDAPAAPAADTGTTTTTTETPAAADNELVTLQLFSMPSNDSGLQDNSYWAQVLRDSLNIQLEMLPAGDDAGTRLATLMASGSLPDIVVFRDDLTYVTDAIEAQYLVNLDDHLHQLPNVTANAANALQFIRDFASSDSGNAFVIPLGVNNQRNQRGSIVGPYVRWDLYKELGSPVLADIEDYIPLLSDMVALEPQTANGQNIYGISLFSDWDGVVPWQVRILCEMYGVTQDGLASMEYNYNNNTLTSIFDDNSYFKRMLQFLFDANQAGILDPDIVTNTWGDYWDKASEGRMMFSYFNWTVGTYETDETRTQGNSYKGVFFDNQRMIIGAPPYVGGDGGNWWIGISSDTNHLDRALAFVDFMFDHDGLWNMAWGEQGIAWDIGDDGLPYRTAEGWAMRGDNLPFSNGGHIGDGINIPQTRGIPWSAVNPRLGARMDELDWPLGPDAPPEFPVDIDWRNVTGAQDDIDYALNRGIYVDAPFILPMAPMPDNISAIADQVENESKAYVYRIILASSQAQFDTLWGELQNRTSGMGVDEVNMWVKENFEIAFNEGARYAG
jgi:putative aldouronate transport system substrate-binding protein